MNKLTKLQKSQLAGILAATLAMMALLWYVGVTAKQDELSKTRKNSVQMQDKLKRAESTMRKEEEILNKLQARAQLLEKRESILAPDRDAYAWLISTINSFVQSHKGITIERYSQPEVSDAGIIPGFPYKWATFRLDGTGYYHSWGQFLADLENSFPYFRVQNLVMSDSSASGIDAEKLHASFELVVPVKASETK